MRMRVVLALIVTAMFPALTLNAWFNRPEEYTDQGAIEIALVFLKNSATFKFDGIEYSIKVDEVRILESYPVQYIVIIRFDSSHSGYGDRAGQVVAQVVTPHSAWIKVVEGKVVSAVLDNTWDELYQKHIHSELIPIEEARDLVIQYISENYNLALQVPEQWAFEILTPEELVGASTQQFTGDGWKINISFPLVITPIYEILVTYIGDISFTWEGTVDQLSNVMEINTSLKFKILMPEDARDIAVEYIIMNIEVMKDIEIPPRWITEEITQPRIVGFSSRRYLSKGWYVNVSNPVVWNPIYELKIKYSGEFEFNWEGTVDQSGIVEEK